MKLLKDLIKSTGLEMLETHNIINPGDICRELKAEHPEVIELLAADLAEKKLFDLCKRWLSTTGVPSEKSPVAQLFLVGEPPPMTITIPNGKPGKFNYIRTDKATREQAHEYKDILEKHIEDARVRADDWDLKLDQLQEGWDKDPSLTIGECLETILSGKIKPQTQEN